VTEAGARVGVAAGAVVGSGVGSLAGGAWAASGGGDSELVAAAMAACFLRVRLLNNMLEVSTTRAPGGPNVGKSRAPTTRPPVLSSPHLASDLRKR